MKERGDFGSVASLRVMILIWLPLVGGCAFGPLALEGSHGRYQQTVKQLRDEEFLRNLVRLRYEDSLNILDIATINSQFALGGTAQATPFSVGPSNGRFRVSNTILPGANVMSDTMPTFTMIPREDPATVQRYLTTAAPGSIVFFVTSGWPVSNILRVWLDEINHIPNAIAPGKEGAVRGTLPDYRRFRRIVDLLQSLVDQKAASFVIEPEDPLRDGFPMPETLAALGSR